MNGYVWLPWPIRQNHGCEPYWPIVWMKSFFVKNMIRAIAQLFETLAAQFSPRTVQCTMSHLYVAGGHSSDSERPMNGRHVYGSGYQLAVP